MKTIGFNDGDKRRDNLKESYLIDFICLFRCHLDFYWFKKSRN